MECDFGFIVNRVLNDIGSLTQSKTGYGNMISQVKQLLILIFGKIKTKWSFNASLIRLK